MIQLLKIRFGNLSDSEVFNDNYHVLISLSEYYLLTRKLTNSTFYLIELELKSNLSHYRESVQC